MEYMEFIAFALNFCAAIINGCNAANEKIPIWLRLIHFFLSIFTAILSVYILVNFLL